MLDQMLGLFDGHFGHLNVAGGWFVKGAGNYLALDATLHFRDFFGALVNQQYDKVTFRIFL